MSDKERRVEPKKDKERSPNPEPKPEPVQLEIVHGVHRKRKAPYV